MENIQEVVNNNNKNKSKIWIQNKEAHIINIGELKLKPGFPQKIENFDELKEKYPALKEKFDKGTIVKLSEKDAIIQKNEIEKELQDRLKKAKMI